MNMQKLKLLILSKEKIEKTNEEIESEIQNLKEQYNKLKGIFSKKEYEILNEIYELRKRQFKGKYELARLTREEGLELTENHLRYIFGWKYLSPYSEKMINSGKISPSIVLYLIRKKSIFRQNKLQDEAVKALVEKKITYHQLRAYPVGRLLKKENKLNQEVFIKNEAQDIQLKLISKLRRLRDDFRANKEFIDEETRVKILKVLHEIQIIIRNKKRGSKGQ